MHIIDVINRHNPLGLLPCHDSNHWCSYQPDCSMTDVQVKCPRSCALCRSIGRSTGRCIATDKTGKRKECKLPFTFYNVTYNGCPPDYNNTSQSWCSTKVDSNGNHVAGIGNFGICSSECPRGTGKNILLILHRSTQVM